jgi:hypothetical protein
MHTPYPENVEGDFYVEAGCCTCCDVPMVEAPKLFAYSEPNDGMHCYVSKQPENESELSDMLTTIACAEFRCIRYRGKDPKILKHLVDRGESDVCDSLYPKGIAALISCTRRWWQLWKH